MVITGIIGLGVASVVVVFVTARLIKDREALRPPKSWSLTNRTYRDDLSQTLKMVCEDYGVTRVRTYGNKYAYVLETVGTTADATLVYEAELWLKVFASKAARQAPLSVACLPHGTVQALQTTVVIQAPDGQTDDVAVMDLYSNHNRDRRAKTEDLQDSDTYPTMSDTYPTRLYLILINTATGDATAMQDRAKKAVVEILKLRGMTQNLDAIVQNIQNQTQACP